MTRPSRGAVGRRPLRSPSSRCFSRRGRSWRFWRRRRGAAGPSRSPRSGKARDGGARMIQGKRLAVVMPAYNAEKTLRRTWEELPREYVDDVILVDDASRDDTARLARELGIRTIVHRENRGYGGNQKTCYRAALALGADIVVMIHPDYQYSPRLVTAMASMVV